MSVNRKATKKPRGKPFVKGDPRINKGGNHNAELQSYQVRFNNAFAEKLPPDEFAAIVAEDVRRHRPGAREFAGKFLLGEPVQKSEVKLTSEKLVIEVVHVKGAEVLGGNGNNGGNGNGNGGAK